MAKFDRPQDINPNLYANPRQKELSIDLKRIDNGFLIEVEDKQIFVKDIEDARLVLYRITDVFIK